MNQPEKKPGDDADFVTRLVALRLNRGYATQQQIASELGIRKASVAAAFKRLGVLAAKDDTQ